jgi:hypothetical protein
VQDAVPAHRDFALTRRAAAIAGDVVPIVALLGAFLLPIAAEDLRLTAIRATVAGDAIPVVALLAGILDPVTAQFQRAR